jgi:chemotaxis protein MotB
MKNAALTILSLALAAAVAFGIISRKNLAETRDSLETERTSRLSIAKDLESTREHFAKSAREIDRLQAELSRVVETEAATHGQLESIEKRAVSERASIAEEAARLKAKLESADARCEALDHEMELLRRHCENRVRKLTEEIGLKDEKIARIENAMSEVERSSSRLEDKILSLTEICDARLGKMKEELSRLSDADKEKKEIEDLLEGERAKSSMLSDKCVSLEENVESLEKQAEAKEKAYRLLESQIEEERKRCEMQVQQLKNELRETLWSLGRIEEKIMDTSSTMEDLRHEAQEMRKRAQQKDRELEAVRSTYETLVTDLRLELERREVRIERIKDMISLEVVDSILFPPGRAGITPEGESVLRKVGNVLKTIKDRPVRVVGHTDNIPIKAEYRSIYPTNWELSAARACSVVRFFQHRIGVPPSRLEPVGRSFYEPAVENDTPEGRALNRRVMIIIGPKLDIP